MSLKKQIEEKLNLALKNKNQLKSYNANYIKTEDAKKLVKKIVLEHIPIMTYLIILSILLLMGLL